MINKIDKILKDLEHNVRYIKSKFREQMSKKIPSTVRNAVWIKYIGKVYEGTCFCCGLETITKSNYECGHIISRKNGGEVHLDNLRPICSLCNKSMGTENMFEFIKKYGFDSEGKI